MLLRLQSQKWNECNWSFILDGRISSSGLHLQQNDREDRALWDIKDVDHLDVRDSVDGAAVLVSEMASAARRSRYLVVDVVGT